MPVNEAIGAALACAVFAALGYVGRLFLDWFGSVRAARTAQMARLVELQSLLRATRVTFNIQNAQAQRLLEMLRVNHAGPLPVEEGYERAFSQFHPQFTPDERELHGIIRSLTVNSLRPLNLQLAEWLRQDRHFKAQWQAQGAQRELAQKLAELEPHLMLWHAKYETWIPDHPEHALVYMADEQAHGVGFPPGLDEAVERALKGA
jgi:hypothetical protein